MSILCLTGWQQEPDALAGIAPHAAHFSYAAYADCAEMFSALPQAADLAIGWSLGGQLLVRAVAGGYIRPKKLLLLAAPFQCVSDGYFSYGTPAEDFLQVREGYVENQSAMMAQFQALVGFGDTKIIRALSQNAEIWPNGLYWLDELGNHTCRKLDFANFPETVIVHGTGDKVIHPENASKFIEYIDHSKIFLLPGLSHALPLQAPDVIRNIIKTCV